MKKNKLIPPEIRKSYHQEFGKFNEQRGSGRTTGIAFSMIGKAIQEPNKWHSFTDHHWNANGNRYLIKKIENILFIHDLKFFNIKLTGNTIEIRCDIWDMT